MEIHWNKVKERWNVWVTDPSDKGKRERQAAGITLVTALVGILIWLAAPGDPPLEGKAERGRIPSIDTFIPMGYTLIPIEIQNRESLDSVFGSHGLVDLYTVDPSGQPRQIARRIKMMRSPKNPQVFAVLANESQAPSIAGQSGPIFVTVLSMKSSGQPEKATKRQSRFQIIEEG